MTAFLGASVECPYCGVAAGEFCIGANVRRQDVAHAQRVHLEARLNQPCSVCGVPVGASCLNQAGLPRVFTHRERLEAHQLAGEQVGDQVGDQVDTPLDPPHSAVDTPHSAVDTPLDTPHSAVDTPLDTPHSAVDTPLDPPHSAVDTPHSAVDAPLDPPSVNLADRERKLLAYIKAASDAAGGRPPELDQADMQRDIPMAKNTLARALSSLKMAGLLTTGETSRGRRGPRVYYLAGQHPSIPIAYQAPAAIAAPPRPVDPPSVGEQVESPVDSPSAEETSGGSTRVPPDWQEKSVHRNLKCQKHMAKLQRSTWPSAAELGGGFWYCPSRLDGRPCSLLYHEEAGVLRYPDDARGQVKPDELASVLVNRGGDTIN